MANQMLVEVCVLAPSFNDACRALSNSHAFVVECKSIVQASHPTIVSDGNSFGCMSGGVDGIINTHLSSFMHKGYVQDFVKAKIIKEHAGELPVGSAVVVATTHPKHKILIYAPTMRVPEPLPADSLAPYLAFRAVLVAAKRIGIDAISVPLFGTGAGEMPVRKACLQMRAALESIESMPKITGFPNELTMAWHHHTKLIRLE